MCGFFDVWMCGKKENGYELNISSEPVLEILKNYEVTKDPSNYDSSSTYYAFKIWALSIFLSPVLFILVKSLVEGISNLTLAGIVGIYIFLIYKGGIYSVISLITLIVMTHHIFENSTVKLELRIWTQFVVLVLWYFTFIMVYWEYNILNYLFELPIFYLLSLTLGVWMFKIPNKFQNKVVYENEILDEGML